MTTLSIGGNSRLDSAAKAMPRYSSPASFSSIKAFTVFYVTLVACMFSVDAAEYISTEGARGCVCDFDNATDYFPDKLTVERANYFNITYFKNYKVIETFIPASIDFSGNALPAENLTYVGTLCGTPAPNASDFVDDAVFLELPLRKVGLSSTTLIPFFEYLNQRSSIAFQSTTRTHSQCMMDRSATGELVLTGFYPTWDELDWDPSVAVETTAENFDAFFSETNVGSPTYPTIRIGEKFETNILDRAEYVEFVAAFFNRESAAKSILDNTIARYDCAKQEIIDALAANTITKSKVVFLTGVFFQTGNFTASKHSGSFWSTMVEDAGGEFVTGLPGKFDSTTLATFETPEFLLLDNLNWNEESLFGSPPVGQTFDGLGYTPVDNGEIYLLSTLAQFEGARAEPDVLLLDFIKIFHPTLPAVADHELVFFTNNYNGPNVANDSVPCDDPRAPLYTNWRESPCNVSTPLVTIPGLGTEIDSCLLVPKESSSSITLVGMLTAVLTFTAAAILK